MILNPHVLNEAEKSCMTLVSLFNIGDCQRMLPKLAIGTCQWILNHPVFVARAESAESTLVWQTGLWQDKLVIFLGQAYGSSPVDSTPKQRLHLLI